MWIRCLRIIDINNYYIETYLIIEKFFFYYDRWVFMYIISINFPGVGHQAYDKI